MKAGKIISLLGVAVMTAVLVYGFMAGDFSSDGGEILRNPWGIVSLVDLYTGFTFFSAWIIYREKSVPLAFFWVILMMILGFFSASVYIFLAFYNSKGDWKKFWMGKHADG